MTEAEHIHQLYIIVAALAERIDALEQTRWARFKAWLHELCFGGGGPIFH